MGAVAALATTVVSAAGLGTGGSSAVLGQPLDFAVQVRLDPGERLTPECVSAEVTTGDRRVPPSLVRALVEMTGADTARVRVQTQPSMDEPVIGIQLTLGCTLRMTRRYVVLADPPPSTVAAMAPAFAATPAVVPDTPTPATAAPATASPLAASAAPTTETPPPAATRPEVRNTSAAPPRVATPAELQARAQRRAERRAARAEVAKQRQAARAAVPSDAPRLKLESAEPASVTAATAATAAATATAAVEEALVVVAQAASAARVAASAASASAERIASLERTVEQLRSEAKTSRDLATQFRQRLTETEGAGAWMLPLMALAVLLAALSAWLAWRLGRVQAERQQRWREASAPKPPPPVTLQEATPSRQPTAPIPFVTSELKAPAPTPAANRRSSPAWPPPAPPVAWPPPDSTHSPDAGQTTEAGLGPEPPMQRTEPMPSTLRNDEGAPRDVSIEELIDLEQQAEFFVVLGQDDAAIDLLVEHLRSSGGGSPLPYLKLLEIHHRRDDRESYERMRGRFNHRFNAYAPEWGVDLGHGRSLDDYTGVLPRLQQVWTRPLDAMAELEALLFRKSRGELFDLPAYREVLFLYSLARDLLDRAAADTGNVDLLLPMADGSELTGTMPVPHLGLGRDAFRDTQGPDELPTGPVDFDVSAAERRTSIFDLLEEPATQPNAPKRGERG